MAVFKRHNWKRRPHRQILNGELVRTRNLDKRARMDARWLAFQRFVAERKGVQSEQTVWIVRGFWKVLGAVVDRGIKNRLKVYQRGRDLEQQHLRTWDKFVHAWGEAHAAKLAGHGLAAFWWRLRQRALHVQVNKYREISATRARWAYSGFLQPPKVQQRRGRNAHH